MLRVETKEKGIRILKDIALLCERIMDMDDSILVSVLNESQNAIIKFGEYLEKEENTTEIISMMENLCETFYLLSENLIDKSTYKREILVLLEKIISLVSEVPSVYQIVFFPYKADMWDSLESIWLACKTDPRCECKVVPIPYIHYDEENGKWLFRYEIDRFPSYVPVIHYKDYSLEEMADAAFVHNPYDQRNNVTNIHGDYFSCNLKKYIKNLFYVPYYVTSGFLSDDHKEFPVYSNADYLVVQSKSFKEGFKEYSYYDKAIVMGSPKLDRVIQLSRKEDNIPLEWKAFINNRKTLMLNTSLSQFLYDGEGYLQKLSYVFDVIKKRNDVAIIWRPHPLLYSTIEAMRPHLLDAYVELQKRFEEEKIGIFDNTSDILNTVAIADGYIGETASSVINLFQVAGKPLFILNNCINNDYTVEERQKMFLLNCEKVGDRYFCNSLESGYICVTEGGEWSHMKKILEVKSLPKWLPSFGYSVRIENKIYNMPILAEEFYEYDINENKMVQISSINERRFLSYRYVAKYANKVFYIPNNSNYIAEYDTISSKWKKHTAPIQALQEEITEQIFETVCGFCVRENELWITTLYSNRVLWFCMKTGNYQVYEIGEKWSRYSAVAVRNHHLYLSDANTGSIIVWDIKAGVQVDSYIMPMGYQVFCNTQDRAMAHFQLIVVNEQLFAVPFTSNALVQIDLGTGKTTIDAEEFWIDVLESANDYRPELHGVISMCKMVDESTLLIQKRRDASLLELNVFTGEYKIHHPKLADGELEKMLDGEDGFEKSYSDGEFACRESRYFSFEGFLDDLVNERFGDAMIRQKKAMETMAVNLDGTCGEKVHEFMMQVLSK